jgi:hypothetical protein
VTLHSLNVLEKHTIDCGSGTDTVQADPTDELAANCDNY